MSYTELPQKCFSGFTYPHDNACCYRATVESVDKGVYTVSWLESTPPNSTNPAKISALSYDPGWCLAPCLAEPPLYPFCSGDVILVLDNQSSGSGRFLIIGYDDELMPGHASPLVPCVPNNLGFHIADAKYGAPYYTKATDSTGNKQCTPINPFEDYGGLTIPKGTLTNTEPVIIIATTPGNCTCIKKFQAAGFPILCNIADTIAGVNGYSACFNIGDGELNVDTVYNNGSRINFSRTTTCLKSGSVVGNYTQSEPVTLTQAGGLPGPYNFIFYGSLPANFLQYHSAQTPISGPDGIYAIWPFGSPQSKLCYTFTKNPDGTVTPTFSNVLGDYGSFTNSFTPADAESYATSTAENGSPEEGGTWNAVIAGNAILADNGYDFQVSKTVSFTETMAITVDNSSGSGSTNQTVSASSTYTIGKITSWTNTINQTYNSQYSPTNRGSLTLSTSEEYNYLVAINIAAGQIIRLRIQSTGSGSSSTDYATDVTTYTGTLTGGVYLELISKDGTAVLESWSGSVNLGDQMLEMYSFIKTAASEYSSYTPPRSIPTSSDCCMDSASDNVLQLADNLFNGCWSTFASVSQYYDPGINMTGACLLSAGGAYPLVVMFPCMDGRCMHVQYTLNEVQIDRYFVDSVEYTMAQLQNR